MILETLAMNLAGNIPIFFVLALIATALWGDAALIFFVAFSVNYNLSLWIVFLASYVGTLIGDSAWFILSMRFGHHIEKNPKLKKAYQKIAKIIDVLFGTKHLLALTIVKYLYGTRVITIFYLVKEKISYRKFVYYDFISTLFWIIGIGFFGWLIGKGFVLIKTFKDMQLAVTVLLLFFAVFYVFQREINYYIEYKLKLKLKKRKKKGKK
jgi:membrane protein DedA with SNARE-associated domain